MCGAPKLAAIRLTPSGFVAARDREPRCAACALDHALTWVIVGDLGQLEEPIRRLGLGDVQVLDADGRVLR